MVTKKKTVKKTVKKEVGEIETPEVKEKEKKRAIGSIKG